MVVNLLNDNLIRWIIFHFKKFRITNFINFETILKLLTREVATAS